MAFAKSIKDVMPGMGSATTYVKREGVTLSIGANAVTLPAAGSFAPTISAGRLRFKESSVAAGGTTQVTSITATDGSTTVTLMGPQTALVANALYDMDTDFRLDISATSITVNVTMGVAAGVGDFEVAGNP